MDELKDLVTFKPNKMLPVHRWFYYKEAFSKQLVDLVLREFNPKCVLDPFCGSGTTLLACRQSGINSTGLDTNPIALVASRAKTMDYDTKHLSQEIRSVISAKVSMKECGNGIKQYFDAKSLGRLVFYRSLANEKYYKDFFLLALANSAYECSKVVRDGYALKQKKKSFIPIKASFERNLKLMERDLKRISLSGKSEVIEMDSRDMKLPRKFDAVITSPPYMGIIDYTKAYAIENFVAGKPIIKWIDDENYAKDIEKVFLNLADVCKKDARVAWVTWDGFVDGGVVDVIDQTLSIAESVGFSLDDVWTARTKPALVDRTEKVGSLREVVIFLRV